MEIDVLAILMVAFGLFAILMFILFYAYAKKYYNEKHLTEDYEDDEIDLVDIIINGKKYIFNANNYNLIENEKVKVLIENTVHDGIVSKSNYIGNISDYKVIPNKLVLQEEKKEKEEKENYKEIESNEMEDFIPKKKSTM